LTPDELRSAVAIPAQAPCAQPRIEQDGSLAVRLSVIARASAAAKLYNPRFSPPFPQRLENLQVRHAHFLTAAIGLSLLLPVHRVAADNPPQADKAVAGDLAGKLIGTWKLAEASTPGSPSGIGTRLKLFTGTHWCVVQPDPNSGEIVFQHGGRYTLEGDKVKTSTDFAGDSTKSMIGRPGTFTIQIDGDTMKQTDAQGVFNETWKRVK
jgi:hypothetical protein